MDYSFNGEIAALYGVDEAVFIHNLYWWIRKNEANGRHYYDGRNWTYNSIEAFTRLFPFWSAKQVRRIIAKLRDNGVIHIGNYNHRFGDRTQWYALDGLIVDMYENGQMPCAQTGTHKCPNGHTQMPKWAHTNAQMGTALPDSKPDINTDSKPDGESAPTQMTYGEFAKVKLSSDEYGKLVQRLGKDSTADYVARLDGWLAEGHTKKNHYATILNWWRKDGGERKEVSGGKLGTYL